MSFVSSVLSNQGFTPLPVEVWSPSTDFCGAGRGLSIPAVRKKFSLPPDLIPSFEAFTGWRGITQYLAGIGNTTVMEQVIAERAAA